MKTSIMVIISLFILSFCSNGQVHFVHTDLKKALKIPDEVYQLDLSEQKLSKKDLSGNYDLKSWPDDFIQMQSLEAIS